MPREKRDPKTPRESDDFESVAKRLECDEDKERFESALHKIAKTKAKKSQKNSRR